MIVLQATRPAWVPFPAVWIVFIIASVVIILALTREKPDAVISAFLVAFGISYFLYYLALTVVTLAFMPIIGEPGMPNINTPVHLLLYALASTLQLFLAFILFRFRRLSEGFPFLFQKYTVVMAMITAGSVLLCVTWIKYNYANNDVWSIPLYFSGAVIIGTGIITGIRRGITMTYRKSARKRNEEELHAEAMAESATEIENWKGKYETLVSANHSIKHRLAAMERYMAEVAVEFPAEKREKFAATHTAFMRTMNEYNTKTDQVMITYELLTTNVAAIDILLRHFFVQLNENGIDFSLKLSGSIVNMIEKVIPCGKLETMIGDHLQDAMTAVNAGDAPIRTVMVMLGAFGEHYEFSVLDSGIPFTADTLTRLGTERVTSYPDSGGTGVGFMTTFQTMRETGASLIISEDALDDPGFTKTVTIRFDGENRYIIETYRPDEFPPSERYTVVDRRR
jgi:signal transduction histidine kinase